MKQETFTRIHLDVISKVRTRTTLIDVTIEMWVIHKFWYVTQPQLDDGRSVEVVSRLTTANNSLYRDNRTSNITTKTYRGPGSSVGIVTELRAGRSEIESRRGRDFSPFQIGPGAPPSLL